MNQTGEAPFWESKPLTAMTPEEWEALCDGCGKCCLIKLEDADTGEFYHTSVHCFLLDSQSCRCSDYDNRKKKVPDCVILRPETIAELGYMPSTCAYRLLAEGKPLYDWHPLISGDPNSVHNSKQSVRGRCRSEKHVPDEALEDFIVEWAK